MLVFWAAWEQDLSVSHDIIKWVHNIGLSELNTTIHADQAESRANVFLITLKPGRRVKALYKCKRIGLSQG